jgi:hypothetical protein
MFGVIGRGAREAGRLLRRGKKVSPFAPPSPSAVQPGPALNRAVKGTDVVGSSQPGFKAAAKSFVAPGGPGRKIGKVGMLGLGIEGASNLFFGRSPGRAIYNSLTGGTEPEPELDIQRVLGELPAFEGPSLGERFKAFTEENPYISVTPPPFMGDFQADAARQRANLDDYLGATGQYSRNQADAIANAYQQMSQKTLADSGDVFQRGQVTAADIDQLYETLAAENLGTAYGEGVSAPVSDVSGLAGPAGVAATSGDVARTYGGSLADYLGQQAGFESAALEQTAASQALQGAALAQSLRDYVTMAEAEKRYMLGRELSSQERQVAQQEGLMKYESDMMENDYKRQLAQQLFGYESMDSVSASQRAEEQRQVATIAVTLWSQATPERRAAYERLVGGLKGQEGLEAFVKLVYDNPEIINFIGG